jgi:DNA-binding HxlR family transcriptional regulator
MGGFGPSGGADAGELDGRGLEQARSAIGLALAVVGERWTLLVLREAFSGVRRFDSFQRNLGIARNILADRLAKLVDHGVLERRLYQERPARSEYRLTAKGLDLYPALVALMRWSQRHVPGVGEPPTPVLLHLTCGRPTEPRLVCSACGEELRAREVRARATA